MPLHTYIAGTNPYAKVKGVRLADRTGSSQSLAFSYEGVWGFSRQRQMRTWSLHSHPTKVPESLKWNISVDCFCPTVVSLLLFLKWKSQCGVRCRYFWLEIQKQWCWKSLLSPDLIFGIKFVKKKSNVVPSSIVTFLLCVLLLSWRHHMICINLRLDPPLCVTDRLPATGCYLSPLLSETLSPSCFFFSPASRLFKGLRNGLISVWLCGCAFVACDHRACFFFFFNAFLLQSRCRAELHVSVQMATLARGKRAATHTHTLVYISLFIQPHEWLAFSCQHTSVMFAFHSLSLSHLFALRCLAVSPSLSCRCALRMPFEVFSRCSSSAPKPPICPGKTLFFSRPRLLFTSPQFLFFLSFSRDLINGSRAHKHAHTRCILTLIAF